MGWQMIKCAASDLVSESLTSESPVQSYCYKEHGTGLLKFEPAFGVFVHIRKHVRKNTS